MAGTDTGMKWLKRQVDKLPQGSRYSGEGVLTPTSAEQAGGASWRSKIEDNMRETPKDKANSLKETLNRAEANQEVENIRDAVQKARAEKKGITVDQMKQNMANEYEKSLKAGDFYKKGGKVKSSASKRADGIAQRGKTKGRYL